MTFGLIIHTLRDYCAKYSGSGFDTGGTKSKNLGQVKILKALYNLAMFSVVEAIKELRFGPELTFR